jgi:hypothetical protein
VVDDLNRFVYRVNPNFNSGQSESCDPTAQEVCQSQPVEGNYHVPMNSSFFARLREAVTKYPDILPAHLIARAKALSCAGCHQLSNGDRLGGKSALSWPPSRGFVHVDETATEPVPGETGKRRYMISRALEEFLKHRQTLLEHVLGQ